MSVQVEPISAALVDVRAAATYLGLSASMIYKLCDEGQLPFVKLGRARRIRRTDLDLLIVRSLVTEPASVSE